MVKSKKLHAIMVSVPYQGHINPFANLALKLASKGITVTFVHLEIVHYQLAKAGHSIGRDVDFFSQARQSGLDIRYMTISDGFPLEFDRGLNGEEYTDKMLNNFPSIVDEFVAKVIRSEPSLAHFLVADAVYAWPAFIAQKHNLVYVSYWTQPALVFSLFYHMDLLRQYGHFPCKDDIEEEINYIPGVKATTRDLMPNLKGAQAESSTTKALSMAFEGVKKADFVVHNNVHELEIETLSALNKYHPNYSIGPINFSKDVARNIVNMSLWSESDCTQWLDSKPPGSVLYISFGSLIQTNKEVIAEIAYGLLLSEVNFIWVVREGITGYGDVDVLPAGFEAEVKDRGLIVPWCDQISVLSNPAIGGFLTHCGWNSIMESMWCGVPMICYPITYDQPANRKFVVDDWKIGINLCVGKSIKRGEVGKKIKKFMSGAVLGSLKKEADKVKKFLNNAMENDGSSETSFDRFMNDLKAKVDSKARESMNEYGTTLC